MEEFTPSLVLTGSRMQPGFRINFRAVVHPSQRMMELGVVAVARSMAIVPAKVARKITGA
jgi:hypothetical protein